MSDSVPEELTSGKQVCAVMVTYHPDAGLPDRVERLLLEVGALVIVDNGSADAELEMLEKLCSKAPITLVANHANLGVARALNIGIERAIAGGFGWVLLLDQDSTIDTGMLQALIAVCAAFPDRDRLAVLGAGFRDVHRMETQSPGAAMGPPWEEVESVITSGSLIPVAAFASIGPFRDELFIDYVDIDYCYRARARGLRVIKTRAPLMSHAIGASTRHNVLWTDKWTSNHSPDRRYYIARNDTVMLREHGRYPRGSWALKSLARRLRSCKRIVLYEEMKIDKLKAVAQGWWHGVRGRLGPRP